MTVNTGIVKFNIRVTVNGILIEINYARVIIKGKGVNRGAGYGLEVPCEYHFEGDNFSCNWLKEKLTTVKNNRKSLFRQLISRHLWKQVTLVILTLLYLTPRIYFL